MAHRAVAGTPPFYDVAVYHCQQSGEKAVKAFLVLRGISFEKTHDVEVLIELARGIEPYRGWRTWRGRIR
jgi:HEPN domain-containing protein